VANDSIAFDSRILVSQDVNQPIQRRILKIGIGLFVTTLELNTDTEVITVLAAPPLRHPRVPGATVGVHKLHELSAASDQKMGRHPEINDLSEVRMIVCPQTIAEKCFDLATTIATRRQ
jgi:hypothetical protein